MAYICMSSLCLSLSDVYWTDIVEIRYGDSLRSKKRQDSFYSEELHSFWDEIKEFFTMAPWAAVFIYKSVKIAILCNYFQPLKKHQLFSNSGSVYSSDSMRRQRAIILVVFRLQIFPVSLYGTNLIDANYVENCLFCLMDNLALISVKFLLSYIAVSENKRNLTEL